MFIIKELYLKEHSESIEDITIKVITDKLL